MMRRTNGLLEHVRIVLAKPGLDGHEAGVMLIARAFRDAGADVIYLGPRQAPERIAAAVLQEDPDVLGLSILTGAHVIHAQRILEALRAKGVDDVPVLVGGIISPSEAAELRSLGVADVFGPGDRLTEIVERVARVTDRHSPVSKA